MYRADRGRWLDPGGHGRRQFKHPVKPGRLTVAGKPSVDLAPGTLNSILKQVGLKEKW
jgi:predicted RNA binding protein YcfA (HicA-like mRNA interferase family)